MITIVKTSYKYIHHFLFRVKASRDFGSMAEDPSLESFLKDADLEGNSFNL